MKLLSVLLIMTFAQEIIEEETEEVIWEYDYAHNGADWPNI